MTSVLLVVSFAVWMQAAPSGARPAPQAARPGSIQITVSSGVGARLAGASVRADGPTMRQGTTGADGTILLQNLPAGTYRCRIERDGFITLEKEIVVRAGARAPAEAVLTAAPPVPPPPAPPPPPPPSTTPATPALRPGEPRAVSLADLAEELLRDPAPLTERQLGCSGATSARLINARESIAEHSHADADEMIYIVAGEATLKLGDRTHNVGPAWLGIVPRGMSHVLTRRGRTPVVVLSIQSGPVCPR
jgi:mannose-6-phosphate isomerase-like protein (cupin superfamily)